MPPALRLLTRRPPESTVKGAWRATKTASAAWELSALIIHGDIEPPLSDTDQARREPDGDDPYRRDPRSRRHAESPVVNPYAATDQPPHRTPRCGDHRPGQPPGTRPLTGS